MNSNQDVLASDAENGEISRLFDCLVGCVFFFFFSLLALPFGDPASSHALFG